MSETSMGRVPVGDPIPLRFDPTTKQRLEELAAGIGPRRFGALVRVAARRLLADPDRVPEALNQARRASADARRIPWAERPLDLDPETSTRLHQLAHEFHTDRSAIVRVALHRFLTAAGRFRHPVLREDARTDLTCRTRVYLNPSTLVRLEKLIRRNGDARTPAAIRVAVRRLLDDPGDLTADLGTIGAVRDLTPETLGPRTNVHFDDDLRDQLDALAARLDSDRAELMRLAARQLLANPRDLDQAVTEEIYRGDANRAKLLARNTRRQQTADQATAAPASARRRARKGTRSGNGMSSGSTRTPNAALKSWRTSTVPAGCPRCSASGSAASSATRMPMSTWRRHAASLPRRAPPGSTSPSTTNSSRTSTPSPTGSARTVRSWRIWRPHASSASAATSRTGCSTRCSAPRTAGITCWPDMPAVSGFVGQTAVAIPDLRDWVVGRARTTGGSHVSVSAPRLCRVHGGRRPVPDRSARTRRPDRPERVRNAELPHRRHVDVRPRDGEHTSGGNGMSPPRRMAISDVSRVGTGGTYVPAFHCILRRAGFRGRNCRAHPIAAARRCPHNPPCKRPVQMAFARVGSTGR
ncbi:CopG family transcriptional regulator [Rhodococcus opacus]|uniref:ribbon-helix-helix domain-containing protein n=1 Tax=Rhodococcus opacus TaxID=37919 RepID=UPI002264B658|nr:CopG family transcriptional regulator [Rhodococcus opacus]MDX5962637.1 CopG family transcriptional regulator [Rhodococcus opacus]